MAHELEHPGLRHCAQVIEDLGWAGFLCDGDFRLVWVSDEIKTFLGSPPEEEIGVGKHAVEAFTGEAWMRVATQESQVRFFTEVAPFLIDHAKQQGIDLASMLPEPLVQVLDQVTPEPLPTQIRTSIDYIEQVGKTAIYRVDIFLEGLRDESGKLYGVTGLTFMGVRPYLVSLLARGDEAMFERMARLHEPASRQAAILFCDIDGSAELSRTLPTAQYFSLIRALWTDIDNLVAENKGIVGKQAGDGGSAFFLVDDLGSPSAAAAAAIRCAQGMHERSMATFQDVLGDPCRMRIGIHWGSSLYIGQLVPGGRLEVTALGDPMVEGACIQACANAHQTLVSKDVIERLSPEDAAGVGVDPDRVLYRLLREVKPDDARIGRDAASVPVTAI